MQLILIADSRSAYHQPALINYLTRVARLIVIQMQGCVCRSVQLCEMIEHIVGGFYTDAMENGIMCLLIFSVMSLDCNHYFIARK